MLDIGVPLKLNDLDYFIPEKVNGVSNLGQRQIGECDDAEVQLLQCLVRRNKINVSLRNTVNVYAEKPLFIPTRKFLSKPFFVKRCESKDKTVRVCVRGNFICHVLLQQAVQILRLFCSLIFEQFWMKLLVLNQTMCVLGSHVSIKRLGACSKICLNLLHSNEVAREAESKQMHAIMIK